jgi:hypothetical protein
MLVSLFGARTEAQVAPTRFNSYSLECRQRGSLARRTSGTSVPALVFEALSPPKNLRFERESESDAVVGGNCL